MRHFRSLALPLLIGLTGVFQTASGHEVRPAYLQLVLVGTDSVEVLWKVPARGNLRLSLAVVLPEHCVDVTPRVRVLSGGAYFDRWTAVCPGGLVGSQIAVDGLSSTVIDVLVRIERHDGTTQIARLKPTSPSFLVTEAPRPMELVFTYLELGVEHILLGIDHLLFVLALLLIVGSRRRLVGTITAFTVAHSITLFAATLGLVFVPQQPVEAVIALSIVFVAVEIIHGQQGKPGFTAQRPWVVAFVFGLLHGFGFAGALTEIGLPEQSIPLALLFFNVGVEVGQLLFIGAALALFATTRSVRSKLPDWTGSLVPYAIGSMAAFWLIERVTGFL